MTADPTLPPVTIDCVALAQTGINVLIPAIIGLVLLAFGIAFFALSRGRLRKSGVALGLVLLLAGGGAGLALTAPASSASADDCTPRDYAIAGEINQDAPVFPGAHVAITFRLLNTVDRDGSTPIVVTIPKSINITAGTLNVSSTNWTLDAATDPANYLFSYNGPLPKGTMSGDATFNFTASNATSKNVAIQIPVTIVTGSGGDTKTANNSVVFDLTIGGSAG
jgi:hypothetical protein